MGEEENTVSKEKMLDDFEKKLDKIIHEIEKKKTVQVVDVLTAVLLSLATVGSAWCAFQSSLWDGIQTFELVASAQAGRLSSENFIKANQKRMMDGLLLMQYINANEEGNIKIRDFYFSKFDSTMKIATQEWLKFDPFNNTNAPNSPMKMPSYVLKEETDANDQINLSLKKLESADNANSTSDRYVLLTVLFAAVLFFGGIASTLQSILVRNICLILSALIFILTLYLLFNMPVTSI
jgi:hypothetical protein